MTDSVSVCPDHGHFAGELCPSCGRTGRKLLSGARRRRLSKYLSGALRHFPDDAGIALDDSGWAPLDDVVGSVTAKYDWARREHVEAVVATDPKGRFERDYRAGREALRAAYGHSVPVDLDSGDGPVPETLYHGTASENVPSIRQEGLKPMGRQHVHLSGTVADAREVGLRHTDEPVILTIDAAAMKADGHEITKRGTGTYTTNQVPSQYLFRTE
jgi:putative RNA 2'-phosphotransferase